MNAFEETIIYESQKIGGSKIETRFLLDARFNQKNSGSFYIFLHLPVFHNKKTKSAIPPFIVLAFICKSLQSSDNSASTSGTIN